ncbi:stellacyanin-like [Gossypium australe]|uniref:Stellacyanin-like n=1 Tax=Gossypium australe TaxID=47621 RepID=A0A5B6W6N4_9ROSI|nr:stellacyanin-like [Gossypium australe]
MGRKSSMAMAAVFVVLASTLTTYASTTYTVGDSTGWQVPTSNSNLYDDWADNKTFVVGDDLLFNFITGKHDVAEVTEPGYDACTNTDTISTDNKGPVKITLKRTGDHYFICTYPGHCPAGQKLKVQVRSETGDTTPGVLSPPRNAASSLVVTISLVFVSIATFVLLC